MRTILFLLFCIQAQVFSQSPAFENKHQTQYRFSHLGISDGLLPGAINCFYKDSKGFIWISTLSGINRYDGYKMEVFDPDPLNTLTIQDKNFTAIFEDPLQNIWIQADSTTYIFNPRTERFSSDQNVVLKQLGITGGSIKECIKDGQGNYWFIHTQGGITKYSAQDKKAVSINLSALGNGKSAIAISSFKENGNGDFWIVCTNGMLAKLNGQTLKIESIHDQMMQENPDVRNAYKMVVDTESNLWLHSLDDHGVYYYDAKKDSLKNFNKNTPALRLSSNFINAIEKGADSKIWVATDHGGINVIDTKDFSVHAILNNAEIENSLSQNSITALYKDGDGIMWVGTFKNGLDYYHRNNVRFPLYRTLLSDPNSLPFNDINVFAEDGKGNLYMGTNGGGLLYFNRKTGAYTQYLNDPGDPSSISSNIVVSLLYDSLGDLWVGTYRGGLNKMTANGFEVFKHDPTDSTSIADDNIWELFEDAQHILWVGTLRAGLDVMDRQQKTFQNSNADGGKYPIHDNYVAALAQDEKGNMWVGGNTGIDVFNPITGSHTHYAHNARDTTSLSSDYILSIYADSAGAIWVGTQDGLNLFNAEKEQFYRYGIKDGLPGKKIIAIHEDKQHDLWLSSSQGLSQFKSAQNQKKGGRIVGTFKNYNAADGLQGDLFNENAMFRTEKGELLVAGMHGYNLFNPQDFEYNTQKPKVVFTAFNLFNAPVTPDEKINGRVLLNRPINETSEITLKHAENIFSVEFAALDFFQPSKNRYMYRMVGFDKAWQKSIGQERRVTYTNLDPGNYTFEVMASNNDQVWNTVPTKLNIEILPPFYRTLYAYIFYVLATIGILYIARKRIILRQRRNFKIEQEKREADHLHEMDLMKIRFFTNISHEFKTPLSLILAPLEKLKSRELNIQAREQLDTINKNAQKLLTLINQVLNLGNIRKEVQLASAKGDVVQFTREIAASFKGLAKNKGVKLDFKTHTEAFYTAFDMDKLDKILFNLLSNAIKFTPSGGSVGMELKLKDVAHWASHKKLLQIKVSDTGIGISKKNQKQIFERFFKVDRPGEIHNPGSGIGLALVKEYMAIYKGKVAVTSAPGKGTTFKLKIPLDDLGAKPSLIPHNTDNASKNAQNDLKTAKKQGIFNVLIIDDDEDFLTYMAKSLSEFYNVFIAMNGEAGWKKTLSVRPDLVICDWAMPVMNGADLCKKIRMDNRTRHIPFIMLTANMQEKDKLQALKIGVNDYMTKPFSFEVLRTRVQNLIKQRESFQEAYSKKIKVPKTPGKIPLENEDEKLMRKMVQLIGNNISNPDFSVKRLALELGVSRTFLYNKTVVLFQKPPLELITDMRLEQGRELLEKSQLTIAEIAFQVGFNNPKYFTKNFKKKYKVLPSAFKNSI